MNQPGMSRRAFLRSAQGILITFPLFSGFAVATSEKATNVGSLSATPMLDAWLRIDPAGTVTVFTGKVELGQGILTAIAQIAADELDIDLSRVRMVSGDTGACPDEGWTAGSLSIEQSGQAVRQAGAEARHILLELAAESLGANVGDLRVVDGTIRTESGSSTSYWVLATENPLHREASLTQWPKKREHRNLIGTSVPRIDLPGKVSGASSYLQDLQLPGMLHGRIVRPPWPGAALVELDDADTRRLPGVVAIVREGNFVGVVAEREEQAISARAALHEAAVWAKGPELPFPLQELPLRFRDLPLATMELSPGRTTAKAVTEPPSAHVRRVNATYSRPFVAHASIGPSAAIARMDGDTLSIWTHSQAVFPLRRAIARVLKISAESIHVRHAEGSGCYGHNGQDDVALDAALLARAVRGRPVRVQWMRDDEFAWEPLGSAMVMQLDCGLAEDGTIADWNSEFWTGTHAERADLPPGQTNLLAAAQLPQPFPRAEAFEVPLPAGGGSRNAFPYYDVPARVTEHLITRMPVRTSSLRSLGAYANVFAIESMMDELAAAANADPLAFRLRHLRDERARRVLNAVADHVNWKGGQPSGTGRGRGLAFCRYKNLRAYVALVADVEVDLDSGKIRTQALTAAVDAGEVINPDGLKNQIEGGLIQALSWTLKEQVKFDDSGIASRSWASYPILKFSEVPEVDVVIVETPGDAPIGAGEPSVPPVAAAIANAVAAASGVRLRTLPFTPEHVKSASNKV